MFSPDPNWYNAIKTRKSIRNFSSANIDTSLLEKITSILMKINTDDQNIKFQIITENIDKIFKGFFASYGKINGMSAVIIFKGKTSDKNLPLKIGYYGEMVILEAEKLGLGTCWVSGTYNRQNLSSLIKLPDDETILAISPVGFKLQKNSILSSAIRKFLSSHKRKPLSQMVHIYDGCPDWLINGLEAARLAPSALNRQPWIFSVFIDKGKYCVRLTSKNFKTSKSEQLDCGIAMLHFQIGIFDNNIHGCFLPSLNDDCVIFSPND